MNDSPCSRNRGGGSPTRPLGWGICFQSDMDHRCFLVRNLTRGTILAQNVRLADTPRSRRIGLLRHERLEPGEGLWIYPTQAIHTVGMRFPIDVVFLDRRLRVRRIYHHLAPFRMTRWVWGARSVLEVAAGSLASTGTVVGDELRFSPQFFLPR